MTLIIILGFVFMLISTGYLRIIMACLGTLSIILMCLAFYVFVLGLMFTTRQ